MKKRFCLLLTLLFHIETKAAQCSQFNITQTCQDLAPLLNTLPDQYSTLKKVLASPSLYRVQIIYTKIDRTDRNVPQLTYYQYNVDEGRYFYPASTVKLPISLLALEWLNEQQVPGLTAQSAMITDAATPDQTTAHTDRTSDTGLPSIAHYIKKILLVSDNDASNRLYELLGQDRINNSLKQKGLNHSLINHRLGVSLTEEQNRQYNPIQFMDESGRVLLKVPARTSSTSYINTDRPDLGKGYMADGVLVKHPMSFTSKNRLSLGDFDSVIKRVVFPQLFSAQQQFHISEQDRWFVLKYMSMMPTDAASPCYSEEEYPDNYSKFFMFGGKSQSLPSHIRIFNKTGWAYGHIIDGSYIVDLENKIEFFLTAVIYTNENDIINDDLYETQQVALPFLNELGNFLYQYELDRPKPVEADLSEIQQFLAPAE